MAKFISIKTDGGDVLLNGDGCATVSISSGTVIHYHFLAGTTGDVAAITYTGGAALGVLLRDAINYALTANPGGIVAKVKVPSGLAVSGIVVS